MIERVDGLSDLRRSRFARRLAGVLLLTSVFGQAATVAVVPVWVHGVLALLALGMNLATAALAVTCISDNIVLIGEIDAALPETARE